MKEQIEFFDKVSSKAKNRSDKYKVQVLPSDIYSVFQKQNGRCFDCDIPITHIGKKMNTLCVFSSGSYKKGVYGKAEDSIELLCKTCTNETKNNQWVRTNKKNQRIAPKKQDGMYSFGNIHTDGYKTEKVIEKTIEKEIIIEEEIKGNYFEYLDYKFDLNKFVYEYNSGANIGEETKETIESNLKEILDMKINKEMSYLEISDKLGHNSGKFGSFLSRNGFNFSELNKQTNKPYIKFINKEEIILGKEKNYETVLNKKNIVCGIDIDKIEYKYKSGKNICEIKSPEKIKGNIVEIVKMFRSGIASQKIVDKFDLGYSQTILAGFGTFNNLTDFKLLNSNAKINRYLNKLSFNYDLDKIEYRYKNSRKISDINPENTFIIKENLDYILNGLFNQKISCVQISNKLNIGSVLLTNFINYNFNKENGVAIIREEDDISLTEKEDEFEGNILDIDIKTVKPISEEAISEFEIFILNNSNSFMDLSKEIDKLKHIGDEELSYSDAKTHFPIISEAINKENTLDNKIEPLFDTRELKAIEPKDFFIKKYYKHFILLSIIVTMIILSIVI